MRNRGTTVLLLCLLLALADCGQKGPLYHPDATPPAAPSPAPAPATRAPDGSAGAAQR